MTEKKKDQSVTEVAEMFHCSNQTVLNWIASGKIKAYRLGGDGVYRIPWAEVERAKAEWMCRSQTQSALLG